MSEFNWRKDITINIRQSLDYRKCQHMIYFVKGFKAYFPSLSLNGELISPNILGRVEVKCVQCYCYFNLEGVTD